VDDAIRDYEYAIKYLPSSDEESRYQAHFNKGICMRRLGKLEQSIKDLEKAKLMKPDRSSVHNNLGLSYFENGLYEEALQSYGKAIQCDVTGDSASVHYNNRGLAYYHDKKLKEAKDDFDMALEKDPRDPTIYFNRGNVFLNWEPK
jgi:tetratricopeptide (TPR) repeat protein